MAESRELQLILKMKDELSNKLSGITTELEKTNKGAIKSSSSFAGFAKNILGVAAAYMSFRQAYDALSLGVKVAADLQTAEVGLTTLLGSAEEASKTVARLKEEAKRTPFELPGLTQATQLLTSVTKDGNKSIDILLNVGEALAAMGKGQAELDRIIVNLQQIAATGRAATIDIKQFAFAGIPIYEMLSETTGKYGEELADLIENGGVTFDLLVEMFDKANDSGGRFFNAFENQKGTFNQAVSNMKDSWGIFMADIATSSGLFDLLTKSMVAVSDWLGNWRNNLNNLHNDINGFLEVINQNTGLIDILRKSWESIVSVFNNNLKPAISDLWQSLLPFQPYLEILAKAFGTILLTSIVGVIVILGKLAEFLINVLTIAAKVATFFNTLWIQTMNAVQDQIASLIIWYGFLMEKIGQVADWFIEKWSIIRDFFVEVWDSITNTFKNAVDSIMNILQPLIDMMNRVRNGLSNLSSNIGGAVSGAMSSIGGVIGVNDAIIAPGGKVITTHPDDYLIATKTPGKLMGGSGLTINIYGDVTGEEIVNKVSEGIMKRWGRNQKFAIT